MKTKNKLLVGLVVIVLLVGASIYFIKTNTDKKVDVQWPLYEVRYNGKVTGHLLGTMHIGKANMYPLSKTIQDTLDKSDLILSEIKLAELVSQETAELSYKKSTSAPLLMDSLNANQKKQLEEKLTTYNLTMDEIKTFNILGVSTAMQSKLISQTDVKNGVDLKIYDYLLKNKQLKKNQGFETPEEQFTILLTALSTSINTSPDWIDLLPDKKATERTNAAMIETYTNNDTAQYEALLAENTLEDTTILVSDRNKNWLNSIQENFTKEDQSTFIMVGALHLIGEEGLISLLEKAGYEIKLIQ